MTFREENKGYRRKNSLNSIFPFIIKAWYLIDTFLMAYIFLIYQRLLSMEERGKQFLIIHHPLICLLDQNSYSHVIFWDALSMTLWNRPPTLIWMKLFSISISHLCTYTHTNLLVTLFATCCHSRAYINIRHTSIIPFWEGQFFLYKSFFFLNLNMCRDQSPSRF